MRRTAPIILVAFLAPFLASCASTDRVVIDQKGVDQAKYEQDLAECQQTAKQVGTGRDTAEGAAGGAVVGGLLGAIFGNSNTTGAGAGVGAVVGGAGKAGDAQQEKKRVLRNCMSGRGYRVLN